MEEDPLKSWLVKLIHRFATPTMLAGFGGIIVRP